MSAYGFISWKPRGLFTILTLYLLCQFWALPIKQQIKNTMSKIWTNGIQLSDLVENIVGKEKLLVRAISSFHTVFFFLKLSVVDVSN